MNSQSSSTQMPPPAQMMQLIAGGFISKGLAVSARLNIAEQLARGPASADQLASTAHVDAPSLYRLLRMLASVGVFQEHEDGRFSNTEVSNTLRADVPGSMKAMSLFLCGGPLWSAWGELDESIRTGSSGFERVHGSHPFECMKTQPDFARVFDEAMTGLSEQEVVAIHAKYDFSSIGTLVDVAGGQGTLLVSCLKKNPGQRGLLFDRANVLVQARAAVNASGVAARCELVEGDFFKEVPAGADAYMMKYILHDWSDQEALAILKNIRRASKRGTKLLIMDPILRAGNTPDFGKLMDIQMLVFYGTGRERTLPDFERLLGAAGFRMLRVLPTDSAISIIEADCQ